MKKTNVIRIVIQSSKLYGMFLLLLRLTEGILPILQIVLFGVFLDNVIIFMSSSRDTISLARISIFVVITIFLKWFLSTLREYVETNLQHKIEKNLNIDVLDKTAKLKFGYFDDIEIMNLLSRISRSPELIIKNGYSNMLSLLSLFIQFAGIFVIIANFSIVTSVIILSIYIPLIIYSLRNGSVKFQAERDVEVINRGHGYLQDVLLTKEYNKEKTLFQHFSVTNAKWNEQYTKSRKLQLNAFLKYFYKLKIGSIFLSLIASIMIVILLFPLKAGLLTVGLFMSLVNGLITMVNIGSNQLIRGVTELAKLKEFQKDLNKFFSLEEITNGYVGLEQVIRIEKIEFVNVSFKYPNSSDWTLRNLSFEMIRGKRYGFVGLNGAGKSTIVNLLLGLYNNYEGVILINGVDVNKFKRDELKKHFSVALQNFTQFQLQIFENLNLGKNIFTDDRTKNELYSEFEFDKVLNKLPEREKTFLGKLDSRGVELSGGEWQKIVLLRTIFTGADVLIFDEPTSASDPIIESRIFEKIKMLCDENLLMFVTHRLGAIKDVDEIFLLSSGILTEQGNHNHLMNIKGEYYKLFSEQRSWYI